MSLNADGNYCIYLRKSRSDMEAEAHGEGETLARHRTILLQTAQKLSINIAQFYEEVVSGETIASRPVMQQLLSAVENGLWDGVLVVEVERLARGDTLDQGIVSQTFKYSNTQIITPMKTYDPNNEFDEEYFEFGLFMSRREYKTINRRLQNGRVSSVNEGKYVGNKPPYGYQRKKLEHEKGFTLTPDPTQSDVVKMIFEWYANGNDGKRIGVSTIVRKLNEIKIPAAKGNEWTNSSVDGILRNPVYAGFIRWQSRKVVKKSVNGVIKKTRPRSKDYVLKKGLHEPLISEELYDTVQNRFLNKNSVPVKNHYVIKNPLSGLVVCENCGRKMVRRPYSNNLHEDTLLCPYPACHTVASNLCVVEDTVIASIQEYVNASVNSACKINDSSDTISYQDKLIKHHYAELTTLQKQKNSLSDLLDQGIYSSDDFLERSSLLKDKIQEVTAIIDSLKRDIKKDDLEQLTRSSFLPKCEKLLESYYSLDTASRNALLKEIIGKIIYTKDTKNKKGEGNYPSFTLDIYPNIK